MTSVHKTALALAAPAGRLVGRRGDEGSADARLRFPRARSVRGKHWQYSLSLNQAHLIEHLDAGKAGKCECVDGKLSDRLVGPSIGLVVEDVHGAVSDLQKINVPGDRTFSVCG
jgi:hypothetical protein